MPKGRTAKPTAQKKLQGNPGKRALPKGLPNNQGLQLPAPDWLDDYGKAFYNEVLTYWGSCKVVQQQDYHALTLGAVAYSELRNCQAFIAEQGRTYETTNKNGDIMLRAYPQAAMASDASKRLLTLLSHFGMTPSALRNVGMTQVDQAVDPLDELASRRAAQQEKRAKAAK